LLCIPECPWTPDPLASASLLFELQVSATMPGEAHFYYLANKDVEWDQCFQTIFFLTANSCKKWFYKAFQQVSQVGLNNICPYKVQHIFYFFKCHLLDWFLDLQPSLSVWKHWVKCFQTTLSVLRFKLENWGLVLLFLPP
jgi:hypothetical protein